MRFNDFLQSCAADCVAGDANMTNPHDCVADTSSREDNRVDVHLYGRPGLLADECLCVSFDVAWTDREYRFDANADVGLCILDADGHVVPREYAFDEAREAEADAERVLHADKILERWSRDAAESAVG